MKKLILVAAILLSVGPAFAQCDATVTYQWTAPTTGSPVDHYVVELSVNGAAFLPAGETPELRFEVCATVGSEYVLRVAGVDSLGRQGPWSAPSDPYTLPPAPGAPGQPSVALVAAAAVLLLGLLGLVWWRARGGS